MAEVTYRSPGVFTKEIDLSQPSVGSPIGVPGGVIGTSDRGPAFVPITVATYTGFASVFGNTDGEKFGPLAVNEFLKNAQALTYLRVLGIGNGKQRSASTGEVTNAGFVVGNRMVQANGLVAANPKASSGRNDLGRTFILGCFMSESNGSTIFSDAGIQNSNVTDASVVITVAGAVGTGETLTITDTAGKSVAYTAAAVEDLTADPPEFDDSLGGANAIATSLKACIESANGHPTTLTVSAASGGVITVTQDVAGTDGNSACDASSVTNVTAVGGIYSTANQFDGGSNARRPAQPIVRGILMTPSGVIATLSGNFYANGSAKPGGSTVYNQAEAVANIQGGISGAMNMANQRFTLLLNGHKPTGENPNVYTCSFDLQANSYFSNVLNSDPTKIEEAGHMLYGHYDIDRSLAVITGSEILSNLVDCSKGASGKWENIVFLTTGSRARNTSGARQPNYESFVDRFTTPITPFIISQVFGASAYSLFRVQSLDDGSYANTLIKISIENIQPSKSDTYEYGTFDLIVREFSDNDYDRKILEAWRGLTLDPNSDKYVARVIGDQRAYFDFDQADSSQKMVVTGDHPVRSSYIRVQLGTQLKNGQVPKNAVPMGFRGPDHLITSGSGPLTNFGTAGLASTSLDDVLNRTVEPPIPYRKNIKVGNEPNARVQSGLYWGTRFSQQTTINYTQNDLSLLDQSMKTYAKFFPSFDPSNFNFSVGNNPGAADSGGTVLDCDRFNNNIFSLERLQVRTGSDGVADTDQWVSASYIRQGGIAAVPANKTRALKVSDLKTQGNRVFAKFTVLLQGGFNGLDIFNEDKSKLLNAAAKREMGDVTAQGGTSGPTVAAYRKALDIMGTKSDVDIHLLAIPGLRHSSVTDYAIDTVESRFDALYIMDIEERDAVNEVVTGSLGSGESVNITYTVSGFKDRALDTSFAAAYFPDVIVQDPTTLTNVQVPPSTVVLGTFSQNDVKGYPWFAPAGYTRGTLPGALHSSVPLNKTNMDDLYDVDINPITSFPSTGLLVFGQKTLLANASALDRVNVRRLLIYIRRKVRAVADLMLFEPNRQETLDKFNSLVQPIMQQVQERSGVDRFKVVIDATTTTQADIENNTLRGKIFLQPTRTAEFVALDFVVTNAGDAFQNA